MNMRKNGIIMIVVGIFVPFIMCGFFGNYHTYMDKSLGDTILLNLNRIILQTENTIFCSLKSLVGFCFLIILTGSIMIIVNKPPQKADRKLPPQKSDKK